MTLISHAADAGANVQPPSLIEGTAALLCSLSAHFAQAGAVRVTLRELPLPPALQDRLPDTASLRDEIAEAERIRGLGDVPFWEGLLLACAAVGNASRDVVDGAGFHQPKGAAVREQTVEVADLPLSAATAVQAYGRGNILVVSSLMEAADGQLLHLPMLDFRSHAGPSTEPLVRAVASALGGGLLVESGSSYHLYGGGLMRTPDMHAFLGHAAQLNPVTDGRWIAHQHREGACALRVSPRGDGPPRVVGEVQPRQ